MKVTTIRIHLLTGEQAYMTAFALEQVVNAIWREHGDDMADFQGRVFPDGPPDLDEPPEPPEDDYFDCDDIPI